MIHDNILVVDANVFNYMISYQDTGKLPNGIAIYDFERFIDFLETKRIAINDLIRSEFERVCYSPSAKHWLKKHQISGKLVERNPLPLSREHKNKLRENYGFNIRSYDMKYIETSHNTTLKVLVSHNKNDFNRPYRSRTRRRTMDEYLYRELEISIGDTNTCEIMVNQREQKLNNQTETAAANQSLE